MISRRKINKAIVGAITLPFLPNISLGEKAKDVTAVDIDYNALILQRIESNHIFNSLFSYEDINDKKLPVFPKKNKTVYVVMPHGDTARVEKIVEGDNVLVPIREVSFSCENVKTDFSKVITNFIKYQNNALINLLCHSSMRIDYSYIFCRLFLNPTRGWYLKQGRIEYLPDNEFPIILTHPKNFHLFPEVKRVEQFLYPQWNTWFTDNILKNNAFLISGPIGKIARRTGSYYVKNGNITSFVQPRGYLFDMPENVCYIRGIK